MRGGMDIRTDVSAARQRNELLQALELLTRRVRAYVEDERKIHALDRAQNRAVRLVQRVQDEIEAGRRARTSPFAAPRESSGS